MSEGRSEFGMIGLGTMGRALLQNVSDHGFTVSGFNRSLPRLELLRQEAQGKDIQTFQDLSAFVQSIRKPRVVMLLVPAGDATDEVIEELVPLLEPGDFVIDGSNAYYKDTDRRSVAMAEKGLGFLGLGVSGGESGARFGPSMMAGGTPENFERVRAMLEAASAKYNGEPCVALFGPRSAGHYVKMVHNGIEYAIMQMLAECYDVMTRGLGLTASECADTFASWNQGEYKSYLLEISVTTLRFVDPQTGKHLVDLIKDTAKAKGTGKWTSQDAMDLGIAVPSIDAAVNARELSAVRDERIAAEAILGTATAIGDREGTLAALGSAMRLGTILAYAQGMAQLRGASDEYGYDLDLQEVAKVWRAGCIIRSELLELIRQAYDRNPGLANLLIDPAFAAIFKQEQAGFRTALSRAIQAGIPTPSLSSALAYGDGYRSGRLPANLTQAQRDLFGAHTFERLDRDGAFHNEWGA